MACNCATEKQLKELYDRFGYEINPKTKELFFVKTSNLFLKMFGPIILLNSIPFTMLYIAIKKVRNDSHFGISEFLSLNKENSLYVRKQ